MPLHKGVNLQPSLSKQADLHIATHGEVGVMSLVSEKFLLFSK